MKNTLLFILKVLKQNKGESPIVSILVCMGLITFILFYPAALSQATQKSSMVEDVLALSLQIITVEGGLTDRAEDIIFKNLEGKGLIPPGTAYSPAIRSQVILECSADARGGNSSAIVYKNDANPVIEFSIWFPANKDIEFMQNLQSLLGTMPVTPDGLNYYYHLSGAVLSEKYYD